MADKLQNTSQFFRRFTIPPDPLDAQIPRPGPYLFHSVGMLNQFPHYGNQQFFYTKSPPSSESESEENPQPGATNRNRGSNWTDAEARDLLELWRDNFPISKKRNCTVCNAVAKKLNSIFKDQGIPSYCTGTLCRARIQYLQDEYKGVKFWDLTPNITPKEVVEFGLAGAEKRCLP